MDKEFRGNVKRLSRDIASNGRACPRSINPTGVPCSFDLFVVVGLPIIGCGVNGGEFFYGG